MTELEAIQVRHSVRKYSAQPIEACKLAQLREAIQKCNAEVGIHIQLVVEEPKAFSTGVFKYGAFSGVRNYLVLAGKKEAEERIGYYGEHIVLLAQTLGLNTCWVALTYKKIPGTFTLEEGERVHCVIALGYGVIQGVQHPMKSVEKFYESEGVPPEWFLNGVKAALLAPTAVNQQKFKFVLQDRNKVQAKTLFSLAGYTKIDLGIVKYHFEMGAGKENFTWA